MLRDSQLVPDPGGHLPGRGAYVHRSADCINEAVSRHGFARSFRAAVRVPNDHLDWISD